LNDEYWLLKTLSLREEAAPMVTMKQQVRKFDGNFHLLGRLTIPHTNPLNTVEGTAGDACVVKQYPVIYDGIAGYGSLLLI